MPLLRRSSPSSPSRSRGDDVVTPWGVVRRVARQMVIVLPLYTVAIVIGTLGSWVIAEGIYRARGRPNHWTTRQVAMQSMQGFYFLGPRAATNLIAFEALALGRDRPFFEAAAGRTGWKTAGEGRLKRAAPETSTAEIVYRIDPRDRVTGVVVHLPAVSLRDAMGIESRLRMAWGVADGALDPLDPDIPVHGLVVWRRPEVYYILEFIPGPEDMFQVRIEGRHALDPLFVERLAIGGLSPGDPRARAMREELANPLGAVTALGPQTVPAMAPGIMAKPRK